jgi:hypothetical protein
MMTEGMLCGALSQNIPYYSTWTRDAIDALLEAFPRAAEHVNRYGDTPLLIACRNGLRTRDENSLLGWAAECMIYNCPTAASVADSNARLPLYDVADLGGGPMGMILKLAQAYPEALNGPASPLVHMLDCSLYWDRARTIIRLHPRAALAIAGPLNTFQTLWFRLENTFRDEIGPRGRPFNLNEDIPLLASKMMASHDAGNEGLYANAKDTLLVLLQAAYHGTAQDDEMPDGITFRALHAAAGLPIPSKIVRLMIELYPEQLGQADEANGWTPLHVAAASRRLHSRGFSEIDSPTAVDILVEKHPAAARLLDRQGRLPLHLALKAGKCWTFGIQSLALAAPITVRIANGISGLYPFQEAAITENNLFAGYMVLDTVFGLLQVDPSVLNLALHR